MLFQALQTKEKSMQISITVSWEAWQPTEKYRAWCYHAVSLASLPQSRRAGSSKGTAAPESAFVCICVLNISVEVGGV